MVILDRSFSCLSDIVALVVDDLGVVVELLFLLLFDDAALALLLGGAALALACCLALLDDADVGFLEKNENRFFCFGGGLVDFAMVLLYRRGLGIKA